MLYGYVWGMIAESNQKKYQYMGGATARGFAPWISDDLY
jgi:hypothetical protein